MSEIENTSEFIERQIVIGMITSTEYLHQIRKLWSPKWMESDTAKMLTSWCVEYFDEYNKAPGKDIENIYIEKLKAGLSKEKGEWIEEILGSLSEEYAKTEPDKYKVDLAKKYFEERHTKLILEDAEFELRKGNLETTAEILTKYAPLIKEDATTIDPFSRQVKEKIKKAFTEREQPLILFPKAIGQFWNSEMIRGGFVAMMGREKIGKTFTLIDIAFRAVRCGNRVAFFQAGDMTELQQLRRFAIYLAGRSDQERYCQPMWVPTVDCLNNQMDKCNKKERECEHGAILKNKREITYDNLVKLARDYPEYQPCHNCRELKGSPWLVYKKEVSPLIWEEAYRYLREFGKKYNASFRMSTHANETLSVRDIKSYLSAWKKEDGFEPDVIIIDYVDILAPDSDIIRLDFRHQQNRIWQRLRNLSQEYNCLVITVTQIKAAGYEKELLTMEDFSEDKRKMAHATAIFGLNQTPEEKRIGLMRINPIVIRDSDFDISRPVTVLQRLQMGRAILGSYW
jgi:hypothetical protein